MTAACRLCGQIMAGQLVAGAGVPLIGEAGREAIEYQATIMQLVQHAATHHAEHFQVLQATAQNYLFQLVAKLAVSSDPEFKQEREEARLLLYWTLAGNLEFSKPNGAAITTEA